MAISRMVAGGASGGMDDDVMPMSDERARALEQEADVAMREETAKMAAPSAKPKSKMSDRQATALMAQADVAKSETLANLRSAPAEPRRSIARAAQANDNRFAPIAGSMGAGRMVREDGTIKGEGFFGPVRHSAGTSATELSTGHGPPASFPYTHKDEMLYPSMVPTLSREELSTMLAGGENWPASIYQKAKSHAIARLAQGKSPFAQVGEQYPAPGYEADFMSAYPSAVMSYPNRTVGYQYAAGAPVTPYMSPVASRPVPQGAIMSMTRRSR